VPRRAAIGALHSSCRKHGAEACYASLLLSGRGQLTVLDHEGIELADTVDVEVKAAESAQQVVNGEVMNGASMNDVRIGFSPAPIR
jgi:hypothetical protein